MGRFKSNVLAPRHRHRPPRDSRDLDGRLSGSLAAFKFAICTRFKKTDPILFGKISHPPDSFISKNEGMAEPQAYDAFAESLCGKVRDVMQSPWYRQAFATRIK